MKIESFLSDFKTKTINDFSSLDTTFCCKGAMNILKMLKKRRLTPFFDTFDIEKNYKQILIATLKDKLSYGILKKGL